MAQRIRDLREIVGLTPEDMARLTDVSLEEYLRCEAGESDLNFAFIYRCAQACGVDVTDIIEGASPRLSNYTLTRAGEGQHIEHAHGMTYYNMAARFKKRVAEPLYVVAEYSEEAQLRPIECTTHEGQECDIVLSGQLKVQVGEHIEILNPGDIIYYNSTASHGMIATGGRECVFYAIVLEGPEDAVPAPVREKKLERRPEPAKPDQEPRIWEKFITVQEGGDGSLEKIEFKDPDSFNFAFDVVDGLARRKPDKLAMLHVDRHKVERYFTFQDMARYSSRAANYFLSLGIKRGDRVLLILKRHYQFWFAILGLHKIGAVALLASNQMMEHDLAYRYQAAGISAVVCTSNGQVSYEAERAAEQFPGMVKIMVDGRREGWHDFDGEFRLFSDEFVREKDAPCGEDLMLMFFTSGTTGFPKAAAQCYKYPLGHFVTAKYWHCVDPEGLHLTISDTGWAKAMWGKLYGQWLNEAAVFVYDFDRFDAADILPMFAKYKITTFCAPPTMYRMLIKQDLSHYDLSSIEHATIAGEALNPEVFHQFQKHTGLSLMEGFGQSETTVMIGNLVGMRPKPGSMGKPVPLYPVDLVDPDGNSVADGQVGEIVIRAEKTDICGLFRGYYRNEEGTNAAWHDGLYHTGDTAWRDEDGYFWYVGRVDDLIKSSGYRIGPFEIESVIMELPYVLECGVSAAPDEVRGQVVKASIVLVPGAEGTEELKKEIQSYVKEHTAPYKYPRIIVFKDELPKTTSGKIIRNKL
ncbi:MAG: AMP-binding protein [Oscillospiraceae bacterium]|nr:AMP-binding protein [Oscillospiraceae bacterium]